MRKYTPRRQSSRWLDSDCPRGVLAIYDNGGATTDRYTVFYAGLIETAEYGAWVGYRTMSENPSHPQGVGVYGEMRRHEAADYRYRARHQACAWSSLPEAVKACVRRDLEE